MTPSITPPVSHCDVTLTDGSDAVSKDALRLQWRCLPRLFSMTAHHHWDYHNILLGIHGRIEIDHPCVAGPSGRSWDTRVLWCVPQLTKSASNALWSIPMTTHIYMRYCSTDIPVDYHILLYIHLDNVSAHCNIRNTTWWLWWAIYLG